MIGPWRGLRDHSARCGTAAGDDSCGGPTAATARIDSRRRHKLGHWRRAPQSFHHLVRPRASYPAQTDDRGAFTIEGIKPGAYSLDAERQGFVDHNSEDDSAHIALAPGQTLTGVTVKLSPQGVITGRVVDEDGDAWTNATVRIYRNEWKDGRRQLQEFNSALPNDLGEFRIAGLSPGKGGGAETHQPTWYPNSLGAQGAAAVTVSTGDQVAGVEIRLRIGSVHSVRGKIEGGENIPSQTVGPFGARSIVAAPPDLSSSVNERLHADGTFEIPNVAPGDYSISVWQGFPTAQLGEVRVQVADRDVDGVTISLIAPRAIKGSVQIEQGGAEASGVGVTLGRVEGGYRSSEVSKADGTLEFPNLGAGAYHVSVNGGNGWYLKTPRFGNTIVNDGIISLPGPDAPLVLTLSGRGAHLTGAVTTAADRKIDPDAAPKVLLIPTEPSGETYIGVLDQNGMYSFDKMLAPGDYQLYAFEAIAQGLWEDAEFLKEVSAKGTDVKLGASDSQRVDIPLITKADLAQTLRKLGID